MHTESTGWCGIGQIKVKVEDVLLFDSQFSADDVHQQITAFQLACDYSQYRQHVLLLAQLHAIVYLTVEVDGKIADLQ